MTAKPSVDAIWRQLKQQRITTKDATRLESLWDHVRSGTCSTDSKANKQQQLQFSSCAQQASSRDKDMQRACDALRSGLQDGSAVPQLTLALQSRDVGAVKAALQQLQVSRWCLLCCCHAMHTSWAAFLQSTRSL
jgi:hypothetical protein